MSSIINRFFPSYLSCIIFRRKEMKSMNNRFSDRVKLLMSKHGWSMRDLSRQSRVPYSTIYDVLESGKVQPDNLTARNLKRLARTLGTSIDYLVGTFEDDDQGDGEPADVAVGGA